MCNVHGEEIVSVISSRIKALLFLQIITFAGLVEAAGDSLFRLLSVEGGVERSSDGSDWVPIEEKTELESDIVRMRSQLNEEVQKVMSFSQ